MYVCMYVCNLVYVFVNVFVFILFYTDCYGTVPIELRQNLVIKNNILLCLRTILSDLLVVNPIEARLVLNGAFFTLTSLYYLNILFYH